MRKLNIQHALRDQQLRFGIGLTIIGLTLISLQIFWVNTGKWILPSSLSVTYHFGAGELFSTLLLCISFCLFVYRGQQPRKEWMNIAWDYWLSKLAAICTFIVALFPTSMGVDWVQNHQLPAAHIHCLIAAESSFIRLPITEIPLQLATTCNPNSLSFIPIVHQIAAVLLFFILLFSALRFTSRAKQKLIFARLYMVEKTENLQRRYQLYLMSVIIMLASVVVGLSLEFGTSVDYGLMVLEGVSLLSLGFSWLLSSRLLPGTTESNDIELLLSLIE